MSKIIKKDIIEACDLAWRQMQQDREMLLSQYGSLKNLMAESPERWSMLGDTLYKMSDTIVKQTSQVIDFAKLIKKEEKEDLRFSEEEILEISKEINKK